MVRVKLEDVCERGTSNLKMSDVTDLSGNYPIYGAAGYIGNVDFYHQINPYVAIVKDGAGIGRAMLCPAQSSIIGTMQYLMPKKNRDLNTDELIAMWKNITDKYPIFSIEDPLDEEDWEGWKKITSELGHKIRLVGDDLFVTNVKRLDRGLRENSANAILIKPNQIGSVTETIKAVRMAQSQGYIAIMSHRSGESEDTTIADLAVGLNTGYIKTGAPCRGERTAKYNQLLRIEEEL